MDTTQTPQDVATATVDNVSNFGDRALALLTYWGPRVLGALLILFIGWLIARAVKWAIAAVVNKTALGRKANRADLHARHPETIGAQVGNAGFWVVLLLAFMPALGVLGLDQAAGPLGRMLDQFGNFVPRLFGAAILFFLGYVLASVAKKAVEAVLVAAHADGLTHRFGVPANSPAATTLPKIAGSIVFALIIIPVAIAALQTLDIRSISDPATAMLALVLDAIPHVIAAGIILALAYAIGRFASGLLQQFLSAMGFDRAVEGLGLFPAAAKAPTVVQPSSSTTSAAPMTPSRLLGGLVFAAIVLFGMMEAFRQLQFEYGSRMMAQILSILGSVLFGGIIIAASIIIARFVARAVQASSGSSPAAAGLIRVAIIILGTAIGLRFMGLADDIINLAFGLILGAMALAAALAFGLGAREPAGRLATKLFGKVERELDTPTAATRPRVTSTPDL